MDNKKRGAVTVSKKAIIQLVQYIAKNCTGVFEVTDTEKKKTISSIMFRQNESDGVYVIKTKKGIIVDVCVMLEHGADSKTVKSDVSGKIKDIMEKMGIAVSGISVRIDRTK